VNRFGLPDLGLGVGLRAQHAREVLRRAPTLRAGDRRASPVELGFLELLTENHLAMDASRSELTERLAAAFPVVLHGVSMNLGSVDPLARRTHARWISDHLCWTGVDGRNNHDLLPVPYTEAALRHLTAKLRAAQDMLGQRIALENPSAYLSYSSSSIPEPEFLARLCEDADCALLLDVNNVFVSGTNLSLDPAAYFDALPCDRVVQIHLAGHSRADGRAEHGASPQSAPSAGPGAARALLIDTHDAPVAAPVWELYAHALRRFGCASTLLEWDAKLPALDALLAELARAAPLRASALAQETARAA
jgi:hypothetical protein